MEDDLLEALNFIRLGKFKEAENIYKNNILNLDKKNPTAFINLAEIYNRTNRSTEAIKLLNYSIALGIKTSTLCCNLGGYYKNSGDNIKALNFFNEAIDLDNENFIAYSNLGNIYLEKNDIFSAIKNYRKSIDLKPDFPDVYNNLGSAYYLEGHYNNAYEVLKKSIELNPYYDDAKFNLSQISLLIGKWEEGWDNYEYRNIKKTQPILPHFLPNLMLWKGEELLSEDKLLIVSEQGYGDTIQFIRFVFYLKKINVNLTFCPQEKLLNLFQFSNNYNIYCDKKNLYKENCTKWIPLLSLPKILNVSPSFNDISSAYLKADKDLFNKWSNIFAKYLGLKVGINWKGDNKTENNPYLRGRSISLINFLEIAKNSKFNIIPVQYGEGREQIKDCSFKNNLIIPDQLEAGLSSFEETAAILSNCDLIITVDSYMAHLSGALGIKTFLILKKIPEWRWGINDSNTFWYESIKIFRQKKNGDWSSLISEISSELVNIANNKVYKL